MIAFDTHMFEIYIQIAESISEGKGITVLFFLFFNFDFVLKLWNLKVEKRTFF